MALRQRTSRDFHGDCIRCDALGKGKPKVWEEDRTLGGVSLLQGNSMIYAS